MILFSLISVALAAPPVGVHGVTLVQPFELKQPMAYQWQAGAPSMNSGTLLVVQVDPKQAIPRQAGGSNLYIGGVPAAVTHPGYTDGNMVVFVPGSPDWSTTPIFWAEGDLPERTTLSDGLELAKAVGADPFPVAEMNRVTLPAIAVNNESELYGHVAGLIEVHAPADRAFAHGYRLGAGQ